MLFDHIFHGVHANLNYRLQNSSVISANLSNIDTPGYRAKKVEFQSALDEIIRSDQRLRMSQTDGSHLNAFGKSHGTHMSEGSVLDRPNQIPTLNGNTVDLDTEMTEFAENTIQYNASSKMMRKKISILRYAVTDGGA